MLFQSYFNGEETHLQAEKWLFIPEKLIIWASFYHGMRLITLRDTVIILVGCYGLNHFGDLPSNPSSILRLYYNMNVKTLSFMVIPLDVRKFSFLGGLSLYMDIIRTLRRIQTTTPALRQHNVASVSEHQLD